jgi:hypothetical protein
MRALLAAIFVLLFVSVQAEAEEFYCKLDCQSQCHDESLLTGCVRACVEDQARSCRHTDADFEHDERVQEEKNAFRRPKVGQSEIDRRIRENAEGAREGTTRFKPRIRD